MEFTWNKVRNVLIFSFTLLISFLSAQSVHLWLKSIDSNEGLRLLIPSIVFLTVFFGLLVIFGFLRVFLFQRRGVKGYQLRGKLAFYFLIVALTSILLVGGLMFYYTALVERNFIANGDRIFSELITGYRYFVRTRKAYFEQEVKKKIRRGFDFPILFKIQSDEIVFLRKKDKEMAAEILKNRGSIFAYFSKEKADQFYFGKNRDLFLKKTSKGIVGLRIEGELAEAFRLLRKNSERYAALNVLRRYILPILIVSFIVLSVPILLGVFFISVSLAKSITENIELIAKGTRLIAEGDLEYRVLVHSGDELQDLARNFNMMATRLKRANEQIKRMERLEAWQEMAKRLAHEIKNPLTPIMLSAERLLFAHEFKAREFPKILDKTTATIINETKRLESLVNEFSGFARLPYLHLVRKDIVPFLKEIVDFFKGAYTDLSFSVRLPEKAVYLDFDENQIKQVIINLITNAIEALPDSSNSISLEGKVEENVFRIGIRDHAGGIPADLKDKIFEPYFTTKEKGTGLGLAIGERIVLEHNGNIWYETRENGTEFIIELPLKRVQ